MKKFKRIFALALIGLLAVGCSKPATTSNTTPAPANTTTETKTEETKTEETKTEAAATNTADVPKLIWLMGDPGKIPADYQKVEEKLNEISVEKVGAKMETIYAKDENVKLMLSSGEDWDMTFTCEWFNFFAVQGRAGYFADLTDKLPTLAPELWASMPEVVWEGAKIDGKILAIPVKKDYAAEIFWQFDKALYENLGMSIPDKMSFFDIEDYLKAAKDAFAAGNELAAQAENPLKLKKGGLGGLDGNFDHINRDALLAIPYSAVGTDAANTIKFLPEEKDWTERLEAMNKWYKAGYINMDAATVEDVGKYSAVKSGQGFYGADAIWSGGSGYTIVISKWSGPYLSTSSIRGSMNAINAKSKNIDLAVKYQNLVNSDQNFRDILRYGIEGEHWNKTGEGLAQRTQAGRDNYNPWPFSQGSYSLSTVEAAEGVKVDPNMWKVVFDGYKDLVATNTIGFSFDTDSVASQVAACTAIKQKYWDGLVTGTLDPKEALPKLISEFESAGVRDIQKEAQAQFDAFLAQ